MSLRFTSTIGFDDAKGEIDIGRKDRITLFQQLIELREEIMADLDFVLITRDYDRAAPNGNLRSGVPLDKRQVTVVLSKERTRKIIIVKFDFCRVFQQYYLASSV